MPFRPDEPYNDLPLLPPAADIESKPILRACIGARAALAELKAAGALIPNPAVLINSLPLLEARASSEIENVVTTSDALVRFAQQEARAQDPATKEALRYRSALRLGFESLKDRPLSTSTAVALCSCLKHTPMDVRRVPGTTLSNAATGEIVYTPPAGEKLLRDRLANWERFVHADSDVDPVIRMAVAHYQFEAIHPFSDGNGRTGRILAILMLVEAGLLELPVLYLSRYILRERAAYYERLQAVTVEGDWEGWIRFMLLAVAETAIWTTRRIEAISTLLEGTIELVRTQAGRIYSRELVEALFEQPYCRIQNLVEAGVAKRQTASVYLKRLVELGVLEEIQAGREKLFMNTGFVRLLTRD